MDADKKNTDKGIGMDALPATIRNSTILTSGNLLQLAAVKEIPFTDPAFYDDQLKNIVQYYSINPDDMDIELQHYAKQLLDAGNVAAAWQVLLSLN